MRCLPSKRKLEITNPPPSCLKTLTLLSENNEHPYSLLMQIYRSGTQKSFIQTPSKSKTKPSHSAPMIWTNYIKDKLKVCLESPQSTSSRLSVLRHKSQLRRSKIQSLTKRIIEVSKGRLKLSNMKLQILDSLKSVQEIRDLFTKKQATLGQIKCLILEIRSERQKAYNEIDEVIENINNLSYKQEQIKEELQHLEQKKSNLSYALDYQNKRNKNLKQKQESVEKQLLSGLGMQRLSKQIFQILILLTQQKNTEILKKNGMINDPNKKKKNRNTVNLTLEEENVIKICYNNRQYLKKIPYTLIILSELYMFLQMKNINRMYLNKISYFCNEAKRIFSMEQFDKLVTDYFIQHCYSTCLSVKSQHCSQGKHLVQDQSNIVLDSVNRDAENSASAQSIKQKQQNCETYLLIAYVSKTCQCGANFFQLIEEKKLEPLLKKYFNAKIDHLQQIEGCCYLKEMNPHKPFKMGSESLRNFQENEETKLGRSNVVVKNEVSEDEDQIEP